MSPKKRRVSRDCAEGCYCDAKSGTCNEAGFCDKQSDCGNGMQCNSDRHSCEPGSGVSMKNDA